MSWGAALSTGGRRRGLRRRPPLPRVEPGTDVGSYIVEEQLGSGGFGTVYLARRGEQRYAVKLVPLAQVGEWGVREVLALSRVRHPNVAGLHGFWRWPDSVPRFLVVAMQYVRGRRLDEWAREENPSALQVVRLVLSLARALEAVHRAKVLHLDMKPANILVREVDGEPVLVDFGVSGWEESTGMTGYVVPLGTYNYRSPESWDFQSRLGQQPGARYRPTPADDLYALGVVLYFLLTDRVPFAVDLPEDAMAVRTQPPVPPHVHNARVPLELSQLCLRLLEKRPEARLGTLELRQQAEPLLERRGAQWEQPLCEAFSVYNQTTRPQPRVDELEVWVRSQQLREQWPRRGKRPPPEGVESSPARIEPAPAAMLPEPEAPRSEALPEPPVPVLTPAAGGSAEPDVLAQPAPVSQVASPAAPAQALPHVEAQVPVAPAEALPKLPFTLRRAALLAAGLGLVATLSVRVWLQAGSAQPLAPAAPVGEPVGWALLLPTWGNGWKLAPPLKPPEAEPVAPAVAPEKEEASVKTPQQQKPQRASAVKKAAAATICTTIACAGPQVLPPPPEPKPCPPGALEAMAQFGIKPGDREDASFRLGTGGDESWIKVKAGWTQVLTGGWKELPGGTLLEGELFLSDRVYGRFTQALTPDGKTYPVCVELYESGGHRGNDRRDNGKGTTAEMHTAVDVRAVNGFK
jgi:serine/threonine protein kinase